MCKDNIQVFLSRNIGHWTGLKAGCRKTDVASWFSFNPGEGFSYNGQRNVKYNFRSLPYPGFTEDVFYYFDHDELSCIGTEYWSFNQEECAKLMQQLGEPKDRLDFYWKDQKIENGEWVYADKGITLGIIAATGLVAWVIVYPNCTLDVYKEKYYNTKLTREFRGKP